jgi:hypothetical protein
VGLRSFRGLSVDPVCLPSDCLQLAIKGDVSCKENIVVFDHYRCCYCNLLLPLCIPQEEGKIFLQNFGTRIPKCTVKAPRRQIFIHVVV